MTSHYNDVYEALMNGVVTTPITTSIKNDFNYLVSIITRYKIEYKLDKKGLRLLESAAKKLVAKYQLDKIEKDYDFQSDFKDLVFNTLVLEAKYHNTITCCPIS